MEAKNKYETVLTLWSHGDRSVGIPPTTMNVTLNLAPESLDREERCYIAEQLLDVLKDIADEPRTGYYQYADDPNDHAARLKRHIAKEAR